MSDTAGFPGGPGGARHDSAWPWGLPFSMVKTDGAEVAWSNRDLPFKDGDAGLLDAFAWNIPLDWAGLADRPTRTFYAERYGGNGIHHNGGGARCAWSGPWLVKGIGVNLLSGYSDADAADLRKNGRASLCEIFVEAIWGEVLHHALPYGAVRMTAVIRTGETIANPPDQTGGIGVREFVWRPAHFMRAYGFHVRPEHRASIPSDTARVKEAIALLSGMLPMPAALPDREIMALQPVERLEIGLEEMVRRFAEQMATAKAKRLSHGTLTPSNISLDGRWNDLNSVSALPSYGYRRNMTPFWADQRSLNETIELLCFYIGKYYPAASGLGREVMPTSGWLSHLYLRHYKSALSRRFVALCGFPQVVLDRIWASPKGEKAMRVLAAQLIAFARSGHSPRRPYDDAMHENTVHGDYDLRKILVEMSGADTSENAEAALNDAITDAQVRQAFVQQYWAVAELMFAEAQEQGVPKASFKRLVAINCRKAGRNIPFLFRNVIFQRCRQLAEDHHELADLRHRAELTIRPVIDEARVVYQEARDFRTFLWCIDRMSLEYDARADCIVANVEGEQSHYPRVIDVGTGISAQIARLVTSMRAFWGDEYEEMMQ